MSSWETEVYFDKIQELSSALAQTAANLQKTADTLACEAPTAIKRAWESENADIFAEKERGLIRQLSETVGNFSNISKEIEEKANRLYQAELHNTLTARVRSY